MDQNSATTEAAGKKSSSMPPMVKLGELIAPRAPQDIPSAGLEDGTLTDLGLKLSYTVARLTADWVGKRLHLSQELANELLVQLSREGLIEETMGSSQARASYRITNRGREQAQRSMEVCAYLGPAPVSLQAYTAMLRWQFSSTQQVTAEDVSKALSGLVLSKKAMKMAGLAVSSGRSLFIYGPSGNGKSSLGRQIHAALSGDYWIPHCISIRNSVIRLYDEQIHQKVEINTDKPWAIDNRWVRIRRPLVIVGGELTLEFLDLIYSPSVRYYEAPPHLKANGGVFLVDDFGRERVDPHQVLNRFITPMEHHIDYFTLNTGQKIQVPLRHVLIIATNMNPDVVTDPAFLRRMGYRLCLEGPTEEGYIRIFQSYAERLGAAVAPEVVTARRAVARFLGRPVGQSGSGPTCWVLYPSLADAVAAAGRVTEALDRGELRLPGAGRPFVHATTIVSAATLRQGPEAVGRTTTEAPT